MSEHAREEVDVDSPEEEEDSGGPDHSGLVVANKYRLVKRLGSGGMGDVYEALHESIGKRVALKCLHPEYARDKGIVERFRREARAATTIGNEHIVDVTDMGDLPDGAPFLVMEYLEGRTVADLLDTEGALPISRAIGIIQQMCDALAAAHEKNIVHRDIKPENVFLLPRKSGDFVKVLDFGISKMQGGKFDRGLTQTGMALGTPHYMSPEQAQGSKHVDGRTDVWATGVILYRALTGQLPFDAESYPMLLMKLVTADPAPVRSHRKDVPPGLDDVVLKTLMKDPDERVRSMRELSTLLEPYAKLDGKPELVSPDAPRRSSRPPRGATTAIVKKEPQTGGDELTNETGEIRTARPPRPAAATIPDDRSNITKEIPARDSAAGPVAVSPALTPAATETVGTATQMGTAIQRGGSRTGLYVGIGAVALLAVVGIAVMASGGGGTATAETTPPASHEAPPPTQTTGTVATPPPDTTSTAVVPPTPPEVPAQPEVPPEVAITIHVNPPDARVEVDGQLFPPNQEVSQPRSTRATIVTITRSGYRTIERVTMFDRDRTFDFEMARGRGIERQSDEGVTAPEPTERRGGSRDGLYHGRTGGFTDEF